MAALAIIFSSGLTITPKNVSSSGTQGTLGRTNADQSPFLGREVENFVQRKCEQRSKDPASIMFLRYRKVGPEETGSFCGVYSIKPIREHTPQPMQTALLTKVSDASTWRLISKNVDGASYYLEANSLRKKNGQLHAWLLHDLRKPILKGRVFSVKSFVRLDCDLFGRAALKVIFYSGQLGEGQIQGHFSPDQKSFDYPPPGSTALAVNRKICEMGE